MKAVSRGLILVAALLLWSLPAQVANADGDPASDVLPIADEYTPYPPPKDADELVKIVQKVFASGHRVKVAVIATRVDLGADPELFGKASEYADFLGQEIGSFYSGPLLVVMPSGYGIYDEGHSTAAEKAVLAKLRVEGSSASALVSDATDAVEKLAAAGALDSPDTQAPSVFPSYATVHPGKTATLTYHVLENSEHASSVVTVYARTKVLAVLHSPMQMVTYEAPVTVTWNVPPNVPKKGLRYCVVATDPSGNRTKPPACTPIAVS